MTGGVACGKSTVARMFSERGVRVIDADQIAHDLLEKGTRVYEDVIARFGRGILDLDGNIVRPKLADAVFNAGRTAELNAIVHPEVIRRQEAWMREVAAKDPDAIVMVEAALLLEAGVRNQFDKIVVVSCPLVMKEARLGNRQRLSPEAAANEVSRRMRAQWPEEKKVAAADYVIENTGSFGTLERLVEEVYRELKKAAEVGAAESSGKKA